MERISTTVYGDDTVGKTALVLRFLRHCFIENFHLCYDEVYLKEFTVGGRPVEICVQDLYRYEFLCPSGDEDLPANESFVLVYNIANRMSFIHLPQLRKRCLANNASAPIVLVGTHSDFENRRQVTKAEAEQLAESWGCPFFETSAKTGENVEEVFAEVVREVRKARGDAAMNDNVNNDEKCTLM